MGEIVKHITRDRVEISIGRTIPMGNYESIRMDVGFGSDVRKGETLDDAFKRVVEKVESKIEELCEPIEAKLKRK